MADYEPTPEAVEVAARAWHEAPSPLPRDDRGSWEDVPAAIREVARAYMTAALTAAGPLIEQAVIERMAGEVEVGLPDHLDRVHFDGTGCGDQTSPGACSSCFGPSPMTAREVGREAARLIARGEGS